MAKHRNSPEISPDQVLCDTQLDDLEFEWLPEAAVESYFRTEFFPKPAIHSSLQRSIKQMMLKHTVPSTPGSELRISNPAPSILYGYKLSTLCPGKLVELAFMGNEIIANSERLSYPFLVVEFKSEDGKMWVATNQCIGGSASCVNVTERLNKQLRDLRSDKFINSTAFSIAMTGTEARLYISWKDDDLKYYVQKVDSFAMQNPDHYIEFRSLEQPCRNSQRKSFWTGDVPPVAIRLIPEQAVPGSRSSHRQINRAVDLTAPRQGVRGQMQTTALHPKTQRRTCSSQASSRGRPGSLRESARLG
ncbi:hypothetical protein O1611_g8009 [Lasiodiplodia mahajangana]|uniref:Uncharacterized protein n=1 Tax=Lasiodiplodia mahajangana TaxID=1108764 RepID=A0ACC2JDT2_9PEZI|nr:hypothetical protein O1611_g8009 [Lasiodiplodia mahajangana]